MKSAQEWIDSEQWHETGNNEILKLIQQVQDNALMHAARTLHGMSRGTKSEERSIAIDEAVYLLIQEANLIQKVP